MFMAFVRKTLARTLAAVGRRSLHFSTADSIPGARITHYCGFVEGSTVRTKDVTKDLLNALKQITGGEMTSYTELLKEARAEAMQRMETRPPWVPMQSSVSGLRHPL